MRHPCSFLRCSYPDARYRPQHHCYSAAIILQLCRKHSKRHCRQHRPARTPLSRSLRVAGALPHTLLGFAQPRRSSSPTPHSPQFPLRNDESAEPCRICVTQISASAAARSLFGIYLGGPVSMAGYLYSRIRLNGRRGKRCSSGHTKRMRRQWTLLAKVLSSTAQNYCDWIGYALLYFTWTSS